MKFASLVLLLSLPLMARDRLQGWCEQGNKTITVNTVTSSTLTPVQRSFPSCTVTVFITGSGGTKASIYSDNSGTPLANPFTAASTGIWFFYADNGTYDVTFGGTISPPFTFSAESVIDPQVIGGVRYADTFSAADACLKIQAAIANLPTEGGTVDARGLEGTLACSANPFGTTSKAVTLLLGAATYVTEAQWVVPNKSRVIGIGRGDPGSKNTTIQTDPDFPTSTAVVSLCDSDHTPCFGVEAEYLTIDCDGIAGCIGGQNSYSQEQSWFKNVLVTNNPADGFLVNFGAQNSGPYANLEVLPGSAGVAATTCFRISVVMGIGVSAFRGLNGITCNGDGYSVLPTRAIYLEGLSPGTISNVHVEHFTDGVVLGSASFGINDVVVTNVETGPENPTSVLITSGSGSQNITIAGVQNSTSMGNVLVDQVNSITMNATTAGLGFYAIGYGAGGAQTIYTTRKDVAINLQTSLNLLKTFTIPGTITGADDASWCFGPATPYCIYAHESNVSGVPGPVFKTQNLGLLIQNGQVTHGATGGGLELNGNGFNTDASAGQIGAGLTSDIGTHTARGTTASFIQFLDGVLNFYADTGLTPGSTFTPTLRWQMPLTGGITNWTPTAFASLGAPRNGTFVYCNDCTNQSNPCTASGSGALAKRLNGAWDCR